MITFIKDQLLYPIFTFLSWFKENELLDLDQSKLSAHQTYIPYGCWHQMKGSATRNLAVALWF